MASGASNPLSVRAQRSVTTAPASQPPPAAAFARSSGTTSPPALASSSGFGARTGRRIEGPRAARKAAGSSESRDNVGVERRSFAQDFFFELMRDSQRVRAVYLAERERWIRSLEISGREEVLFELEMLLRGIDRFFNLRNLFGERLPPADRDFREELKAARDAT